MMQLEARPLFCGWIAFQKLLIFDIFYAILIAMLLELSIVLNFIDASCKSNAIAQNYI